MEERFEDFLNTNTGSQVKRKYVKTEISPLSDVYITFSIFFQDMERSETGTVNYHFHGNIQNLGSVGGASNTSQIGT